MQSFKIIGLVDAYSTTHFLNFWGKLYPNKNEKDFDFQTLLNSPKIDDKLLLKYIESKRGRPFNSLHLGTFKNIFLPNISIIERLLRNKESDFFIIQSACTRFYIYWVFYIANLINPETFPIFDINAFRAFQFIQNKTTDTSEYAGRGDKIVEIYLNEYLPFIEDILIANPLMNNQFIYEALWTFGKFLEDYIDIRE